MFCNFASLTSRPNRRDNPPVSTSPALITRLKLPSFDPPCPSKNTCSIDGTKFTVVTCSLSISPPRYTGSFWPLQAGAKVVLAYANGQNSSDVDTSNAYGVLCNTASCSPNPCVSCNQHSMFTTHRCSTITPFGLPVDPDVYSTHAKFPLFT